MPIISTLAGYGKGWLQSMNNNGVSLRSTAPLSFPLAMVTAVAFYALYKKISQPPESLRHLPYPSVYDVLLYLFKDKPASEYMREVILPVVSLGNGIYVRFAPEGWVVHLADPIAVRTMLLKIDNFHKSATTSGPEGSLIQRYVGGPNIVFLNGTHWKRHRKIANPAFHRAFPVKLFGHLTTKMFAAMDRLGDTVDVVDLFTRLTLDAIGNAGFGFDFNALGELENNEWVNQYNSIKEGMVKPLYFFFPALDTKLVHLIPQRKKIHDNLTRFLNTMDEIIIHKRKVIEMNEKSNEAIDDHEKDLLTLMIESEMTEGEGATLSNEELKSNLCVFFLAGHDTTALALSAALYEMARFPETQEIARNEALDLLGDEPVDVIPTIEETRRMHYINMVIKETLRMHSPLINMTTRVSNEDYDLNGTMLPKGTLVTIDIHGLHHNPKIWSDPWTFKPERFAPGGEADRHPGSGLAWIPFSNGGRQCIGMNFSLVQQRVVLAMILKKYKWRIPDDSIHKTEIKAHGVAFGILNVPDLKLVFEKRY